MTNLMTPNRRRFLQALGSAALPSLALPGFAQAAGAKITNENILVLIELSGGNDGLNTVIPVTDPRYHELRPTIGINRSDAITLDGDTGLHPEMGTLVGLWDAGDLQIVEGVGYPNPNRSHFRSIEIWNSGSGPDGLDQLGWVTTTLGHAQIAGARDAHGLVLGGEMGPLKGPGRFSAVRNVDEYVYMLDNLPGMKHAVRPKPEISPLDHVLATYDSAQHTGERIYQKLERSQDRQWSFPQSELGEQLRTAARLLDAGVSVPVLKVVQGGYDTHDNQQGSHPYLLQDLSNSIGAFAKAMKQIGLWDQVTVVTFSEFGRRAYENSSNGTDHGTAAPVFVAGGKVSGGFTGQRPSLTELYDNDLIHTTDYRRVYDALLTELWGISDNPFADFRQAPLQFRA